MFKALIVMPFVALALSAAAPPPPAPSGPPAGPGIVPPAAVAADPNNRLTLELSNGGTVVILMRPDVAPQAVQRVQTLARQHFYDGLAFHRVIPGFMAQGGDPKGTGEGGSPMPDLKAEFSDLPHLRGTVSMARADAADSANSQFFIMFGPKAALDHKYTIIGRVTQGMDAVDKIAVGEPPAEPTKIVHATVGGAAAATAVPSTAIPLTTDAFPNGG
jgi:cyclophilin family peptidyl-prolyl cis-trans isomerase